MYERPIDRLKETLRPGHKEYHRKFYALNNISFDVEEGQFVGIIGTNGSGKSTILKIITGVLTPTQGEVTVNGRVSALLELGAGFNMEYTGIENIYMNGTMMGYSRQEMDAKLPEILEFADIGEFAGQPVKSYSSGMFARLAFAVAINVEPEILIVDEALSVGDVFFQAKCYKKFEELNIEEYQDKTRAFLKIQDGCDRYCAYCLIPYARGFSRSKALEDIEKCGEESEKMSEKLPEEAFVQNEDGTKSVSDENLRKRFLNRINKINESDYKNILKKERKIIRAN